MTICKLCGNARKLIDAHIIPKSFWNLNHNEIGPLAIVSSAPNWRPKRSQQGPYDQNILCEECDNKLGLFDQHVVETLVKVDGVPIVDEPGAKVMKYEKADPSKVHSFIASVAWRASKSQHYYFGRVSLGPYEDLLQASFGGNEDAQRQLDVFISEFDNRDTSFLNPQFNRFDGVKVLVIPANRFTFYVKVDKQKVPEEFRQLAIRPGSPVLSLVRKWQGSKQYEALRKLVMSNPRPTFWRKWN